MQHSLNAISWPDGGVELSRQSAMAQETYNQLVRVGVGWGLLGWVPGWKPAPELEWKDRVPPGLWSVCPRHISLLFRAFGSNGTKHCTVLNCKGWSCIETRVGCYYRHPTPRNHSLRPSGRGATLQAAIRGPGGASKWMCCRGPSDRLSCETLEIMNNKVFNLI